MQKPHPPAAGILPTQPHKNYFEDIKKKKKTIRFLEAKMNALGGKVFTVLILCLPFNFNPLR